MEEVNPVASLVDCLTVLLGASVDSGEGSSSVPQCTTIFQSVARMCFASIASQAEFSETEACSLITMLVESHLQTSEKLFPLKETGPLFFESALEALTSLISGTNTKSNFVSLAKCYRTKTAKVVTDCLRMCLDSYASQPTVHFLPPISQTANDRTIAESQSVDVLVLTEHCIRVLENLVLYSPLRVELCRELGCCELLVRCLCEVGPVKASIAEHCLAALGNLVDAPDSTLNENTTSADVTAITQEVAQMEKEDLLHPPASHAGPDTQETTRPVSTVSRIVAAGACEETLRALHQYGSEEVSIADCALSLVQALAVRDAEALLRFELYQCATRPALTASKSAFGIATHAASSMDIILHSKERKQITDTHADLNGTMAVLAKVLRSHYEASVTVAESGTGAVGSLVLQSSVLLLHFLTNGGLGLVMCVYDKWGVVSTSISAKAARILTTIVETVRLCRKELHRVNSYYDPKDANHSTLKSYSREERSTRVSTGSRASLASPSNDEYSVTGSVTETDAFDALFECEDDKEVQDIDIGVPGATPAYVYKVLDRVDMSLLLMDAENGVLDKELSKHEGAAAKRRIGMKAVGSAALVASKLKSSSSADTLPRLPCSAQSLTQLSSVLSRTASVRKPSIALGSEVSMLHLVTEETNKETFGPVYGAALSMLQQHGEYCLEVLHPALTLLLTVCDFGAHQYHWAQVSASDGCAILVKVLQNPDILVVHGTEETPDINTVLTAEMGLQILQQLALCNTESKEKLCKLSAHVIAVDILHAHGAQSIFAANLGAHVFVLLYDTISALEANEGNAQACSTIMRLLVLYETANLPFAEVGMCMLKTLTQFKPNQRLLGDNKACAVIVRQLCASTLTERTPHSENIAMHGLATIARLAEYGANQSRLAKCGACKLVVELTQEYGRESESVAAEGLSAISVLAASNRGMLGELGACEVVVVLIAQYITTAAVINDSIAYLTSLAMNNLCLDYEENRLRFHQRNVVPALKAFLTERAFSHRTRDALKDAINIIRF